MLWRWRTEDAARLLPLLDEGPRALARARIGYIEGTEDLDARLAAVPRDLRDDPALAYDRFNWLAARGDWTEAVALLRDRSQSAAALVHPWRWASWRRILARWQMREGKPRVAYALASSISWTTGPLCRSRMAVGLPGADLSRRPRPRPGPFRDLRRGGLDPDLAGARGLLAGPCPRCAGRPRGRQCRLCPRRAAPDDLLRAAGRRASGRPLAPWVAGGEAFADWQSASFARDDRFRAAMLLLSGGERGLAVLFLADLARDLDREAVGQLGDLLMDMDEPFFTVLVAKTALRGGVLVQDHHFPDPPPGRDGPAGGPRAGPGRRPAGKRVSPRRGQRRGRAGPDAADARHRAGHGRCARPALFAGAAGAGLALQRAAGGGLSGLPARRIRRQPGPDRGGLQRRPRARARLDRGAGRPAARRWPAAWT